MPHVDHEAPVPAGVGASREHKIACEDIATSTSTSSSNSDQNLHQQPPVDSDTEQPDFPPESFWLSKDAEFDWFDQNAFMERKDSTKGNSANLNTYLNQGHNPNSSNSQRFSANLKSKPSIFSLPKAQKANFIDSKNRRTCKLGNTQLFTKRASASGKSDSAMVEPSSPKVSCIGRVRSKRDRSRRLKNRQRAAKSVEPEGKSKKAVSKRDKPERKQKTGILSSFRAMFRSGNRRRQSQKNENDSLSGTGSSDVRDRQPSRGKDAARKKVDSVKPVAAVAEPAGIGGMKRFSSGRRSDAWGVGVGVDVA